MRFARLACVALLLVSIAFAQSNSKKGATLSGTVVDATGAVIPGAKVSLNGHGNKVTLTDGEGNFSFAGLRKGWYSLHVQRQAFKTTERKGIEIAGERTYELRIVLEPEKFEDPIILIDEPITIDTKSSSPHNCVTDTEMQSVPIDRSVAGAVSVAGRCP
jgi:Carboxypeptidase regulatory-like domain